MGKRSPTELSLDYLGKQGMTCWIVEKWNSFARIRQDCYGFGDILAYGREAETNIMLVQTTSAANFSARRKKILANPHYKGWIKAGGRVVLHGWGKNGLREEEL